eukprot:360770-Chlamydomonas_euryale.AAC.7
MPTRGVPRGGTGSRAVQSPLAQTPPTRCAPSTSRRGPAHEARHSRRSLHGHFVITGLEAHKHGGACHHAPTRHPCMQPMRAAHACRHACRQCMPSMHAANAGSPCVLPRTCVPPMANSRARRLPSAPLMQPRARKYAPGTRKPTPSRRPHMRCAYSIQNINLNSSSDMELCTFLNSGDALYCAGPGVEADGVRTLCAGLNGWVGGGNPRGKQRGGNLGNRGPRSIFGGMGAPTWETEGRELGKKRSESRRLFFRGGGGGTHLLILCMPVGGCQRRPLACKFPLGHGQAAAGEARYSAEHDHRVDPHCGAAQPPRHLAAQAIADARGQRLRPEREGQLQQGQRGRWKLEEKRCKEKFGCRVRGRRREGRIGVLWKS